MYDSKDELRPIITKEDDVNDIDGANNLDENNNLDEATII